MKLWLDAQLSPAIAKWISGRFGLQAESLIDMGLYTLKDPELFQRSREAGVVLVSKDSDIPELLRRLGPPPQVLYLTCGNTRNDELKRILLASLPRAIELLTSGEALVEIGRAS